MYTVDTVMAGLKQFQRDTVRHVLARLYDDESPARRFLVADETGLGKTKVARGVIAGAIERLQHDPAVQRIDVVYVCSNGAIANQNLKSLDVLGTGAQHHSTRLTLLARDSGQLNGEIHPSVGKRVNLISFTPGTSFDFGSTTGRADERALLHRILDQTLNLDGYGSRVLAAMLQGNIGKLDTFRGYHIAALDGIEPDPSIVVPFVASLRRSGMLKRIQREIEHRGRRTSVTDEEREQYKRLVGDLRAELARAGVAALEPDLVILDEFQRFRHLLDPNDAKFGEAAELAHSLFDYGDAKVLLLSATPYKPFTYAEEAIAGDDHEADLRKVIEFLAGGDSQVVEAIVARLGEFRRRVVSGGVVDDTRQALERSLTQLMCRTERPRLGDDGMLAERITVVDDVTSADVADYAAIRELSKELNAPFNVDYWKSTPYFLNFSDGYKLGDRLKEELNKPDGSEPLRALLHAAQRIDPKRVELLGEIDPGNARMRQLALDSVGAGWWKLLWMPPSMPYRPPGGPFAEVGTISKRLVFSSWAATPTAIASLLSHEARRNMVQAADKLTLRGRLNWRVTDRGPGAMTTLMLFWPSPVHALSADPRNSVDPLMGDAGAESNYWRALFGNPGSRPDGLDLETALRAFGSIVEADPIDAVNDASPAEETTRLRSHLELALGLGAGAPVDGDDTESDPTLEAVARYAPANIAYRCINRIAAAHVPDVTRWAAAVKIADGLRSLFNRTESALLLDQLLADTVYWRAVLAYCAWGNLEAVLDEHLHTMIESRQRDEIDAVVVESFAERVHSALTLRAAQYEAFDPLRPKTRVRFVSRFALRYGNKADAADVRREEREKDVKDSFNSPFWPFILATTSIGQEGLDFHTWCHATVHWNTPASPVDFEQREGRVSRYGGLVVRRNLAHLHGERLLDVLSAESNIWTTAFELGAADDDHDRFGELTPFWICNGPSKVERHLMPYPLSSDIDRYQQLKDDLVLYRLTFGQPRQEDLLELLRRRGVAGDDRQVGSLQLDLRPQRQGS